MRLALESIHANALHDLGILATGETLDDVAPVTGMTATRRL
jgi:hypothetical protein